MCTSEWSTTPFLKRQVLGLGRRRQVISDAVRVLTPFLQRHRCGIRFLIRISLKKTISLEIQGRGGRRGGRASRVVMVCTWNLFFRVDLRSRVWIWISKKRDSANVPFAVIRKSPVPAYRNEASWYECAQKGVEDIFDPSMD